jgi:hypothetical protein
LIVLNSSIKAGLKLTNKVTFIDRDSKVEPMELKVKEAVADDILNKVIAYFHEVKYYLFLLLTFGFAQATAKLYSNR